MSPVPDFVVALREKIGHDPLWLPGVKARVGSALVVLDRLGIARMPWRPVGRLKLDAPPRI